MAMHKAVRRRSAAVAAILLTSAVLSACSGTGSGSRADSGAVSVRLLVTPARALYDTPIGVRVTGLGAGESLELRTSSLDAKGTPWTSSARYRATPAGEVSTAQAPLSGSYAGANPMGLFQGQTPNGSPDAEAIFAPPPTWRITISAVVSGHQAASTTVTRLLAQQTGVTEKDLRPPAAHVYADLFTPPGTAESKRPAALVFGGSEGGMGGAIQAALLAAHGYPAMALAYFGEPGQPKEPERLPLEYFESALRTLAAQPGVDRRDLFVWGWSFGSEAAELLGAQDPDLVHGVIATVPSSDVSSGSPDRSQPLWTRGGVAVRTGTPVDPLNRTPSPVPASIIPVEKIRGPLMLVCGGQDEVWPSCTYTDAIVARLAAHHAPTPTVLKYPQAGHLVGILRADVPDSTTDISYPGAAAGMSEAAGGSPAADAAGEADAWTRLLALLSRSRT